MKIHTSKTEFLESEIKRLRALVRAQQITIDKLEAQRTWVGLTDDDFIDLCEDASNFGTGSLIRHIEAKLKEVNT
jgi:hypothetical protein